MALSLARLLRLQQLPDHFAFGRLSPEGPPHLLHSRQHDTPAERVVLSVCSVNLLRCIECQFVCQSQFNPETLCNGLPPGSIARAPRLTQSAPKHAKSKSSTAPSCHRSVMSAATIWPCLHHSCSTDLVCLPELPPDQMEQLELAPEQREACPAPEAITYHCLNMGMLSKVCSRLSSQLQDP